MLSMFDLFVIGVTLWGMFNWGGALLTDLLKYRTRGKCIIEASGGYNSYYFLGVAYLLVLLGLRHSNLTGLSRTTITAGFLMISAISAYRAVRNQGLYENGLCIPEQNCELTAIKYYKWSPFGEVDGYKDLYLKVVYRNMITRYGAKVIKLQVPIHKLQDVTRLLEAIEGCKEA